MKNIHLTPISLRDLLSTAKLLGPGRFDNDDLHKFMYDGVDTQGETVVRDLRKFFEEPSCQVYKAIRRTEPKKLIGVLIAREFDRKDARGLADSTLSGLSVVSEETDQAFQESAERQHCFFIYDIAVHHSMQRKGFGTTMMTKLLATIDKRPHTYVYVQASAETSAFFTKFEFETIHTHQIPLTDVPGADRRGIPWARYGSKIKRTTPYEAVLMRREPPPPPTPKPVPCHASSYHRSEAHNHTRGEKERHFPGPEEWDNGDPGEDCDFWRRGAYFQTLKKRPLLFWETSRHPQGPVTDEELLGELHDAAAVVYQEDEDKGDDDEDAETEIVDDSSGSSTGHGPIELSAIPAVERHV